MDIKTATLEQLKAAAYDQLAAIEVANLNLRNINQEIQLRSQPTETTNV